MTDSVDVSVDGMRDLILDLQENGGGYMQSAIQIVNEFLHKNDLIVYTEGRSSRRHEYNADGKGKLLDGATMTDCAAAFCETVMQAGYDAGVYIYPSTGYYDYDLSRLTDYTFWCTSIGDHPFFYYAHTLWPAFPCRSVRDAYSCRCP